MAASAFCFSLMGAFVKAAGAHIPTMEVVLARSLIVLALCVIGLRVKGTSVWGNERGLLFVRGVVGSIALVCSYYATIHLPLAEATVIQNTNPVFTALLAGPVLGEAVRGAEVLLAFTSLTGVLVVARPPFLTGASVAVQDPSYIAVAVAGAVFSAGAYVMVRRLRQEAPLVILFYFAVTSVLASLPAVIGNFVMPHGTDWLMLAGVGISTHLGQLFMTNGLQRERAGKATAVGYLQIVFAAIWGSLAFGEFPDRWTVAGALLIVSSTLALTRVHAAPAPEQASNA
jgi:drug/metabolite transporter (DMT)-like permease